MQEKINVNDGQIQGNKTERDPTPAPVKQRTSKRGGVSVTNEEAKAIPSAKQQPCANCKKLEQKLNSFQSNYTQDLENLRKQIAVYQRVFIKLKQKLNLTGDIDFSFPATKGPGGKQNNKKTIKLGNFADLVLMIFKRMFTDLEH